ncbi:MAG: 1-phosphofructokinase family hexose kinase [Anaerolineae bacterium]
MIVSITANTTIDQTLFVPSLPMGRTVRARKTVQSMGGKPTDASWILGEMGIPSLALGFAAGAMKHKVYTLLQARGVQTDFVECDGETRVNTVIITDSGETVTITTNTLVVQPPHLDQLREKFRAVLPQTTVVVLGGTLPTGVAPEFYVEFIGLARERNIPVVFDADEPNLGVGLQAHPTYIKPNHHELEHLTGKTINDLDSAYRAGREIISKYGTCPIITMGKDGALAVLPDKAYFVPPLDIEVVSASGAGDGMLAGITASLYQQQPIEEGLRLGAACAAAVCLLPGTADCRREDVERLLPQVQLQSYP